MTQLLSWLVDGKRAGAELIKQSQLYEHIKQSQVYGMALREGALGVWHARVFVLGSRSICYSLVVEAQCKAGLQLPCTAVSLLET